MGFLPLPNAVNGFDVGEEHPRTYRSCVPLDWYLTATASYLIYTVRICVRYIRMFLAILINRVTVSHEPRSGSKHRKTKRVSQNSALV